MPQYAMYFPGSDATAPGVGVMKVDRPLVTLSDTLSQDFEDVLDVRLYGDPDGDEDDQRDYAESRAALDALLTLANLGVKLVAAGFDPDDLDLLAEGLDSHEYWQLSEPDDRNSGYVLEGAEERDPAIAAVRSLVGRLEKLGAQLSG